MSHESSVVCIFIKVVARRIVLRFDGTLIILKKVFVIVNMNLEEKIKTSGLSNGLFSYFIINVFKFFMLLKLKMSFSFLRKLRKPLKAYVNYKKLKKIFKII